MPLWVVDETEGFRRALEEVNPGYDWTDSLEAARWYLERGPLYVGKETQDHEVRILILDAPRGVPGVKVFYVVEGRTVTLLSARPVEPAQL